MRISREARRARRWLPFAALGALMATFPVYELTVYDSDDASVLFAVGTDTSHAKPYLKVPTDFSEQEVDFVKSSASIGQVTCQVIDKRTVSTDQSTGYITGLLADPSGFSQLNGHRAVLTEDLGAGAAKIMDGVIRGMTLMDTFVGFEFELKDIRERERKTKAFQTTDTPTVLPRGVLNGYGVLTTVPFFESLSFVYPVAPTRPLLCQYLQVTSSEGIVDYGTVPGPRLAELLLTAPMRDVLEHIEPLDGEPAVQVYGWFKVLWRDHATGGAYTTLTQIAQTHPSLQGGGGKPAYGVQTLNNGPSIATLAVNNVVSGATLPSDGQSIDVIVQYDGPVTEDWRYHLQNLTVGELLRNAYRGDYSDEDPRIRYDESALLALTTPVRLSLGKPVEDLRDWLEKNAYPIELAAPTLNDDGQISPRTAALPDASVTPVNLGDSNCRPAGGGWSHPSQDAVNLVVVTYKREYAITNDGSIAASDTLREREVQVPHEIPESIVLLGEQKLEIKSELLRAIGTRDKGGALYGDIQDELGAQVAERITRVATDRFALGGQYFAVDGARSDSDVEGLRKGDWVIAGFSWMPDYVAGTRGLSRLAQVVNRKNLNAAWCSLVLQDAGSANAPVTQPTLGTVTVDSSGVVSVPVSAIGTGDVARVDYAVNTTEPAAGSSLWTYAGRTASPATIKTQAFPPGSTVWVRARGEGVGQRPSAYTTAISVAVGTVPRVVSIAAVIDDATAIPTVTWIPNSYALGVRLYYEVHDTNVVPSFASSVDVDASDLEHEFSALTVDSGEVFSCKLEPYTGWTGSAVSGTAGPDVIVDIIRSASGYALAVQAISDAAGAQATADGKVTTFVQTSAPTAEGVGDLWLDSDDGDRLYRWSGSAWIDVQDADIAQAISDAADAQATADGKIVTFYQASAPTAGEVGDFWIDTDDGNRPYRWSGSAWVSVRDATIATAQSAADAAQAAADDAQATADGKVTTFYQTSAPTAEGVGDLWVDTDDGNKLYRWSGSAWVSARDGTIAAAQSSADTAQATADGKIVSFYQTSAPAAGEVGDIWIDTDDNNKPYRWSGSAWVSVRDATIATAQSAADAAQSAADDAQATADGKITTFYQTSAPTADGVGDLWVDTDDGNKLYRWSGSAWVSARDGTIATAQSTADTAQATADGKIVSFYATSAPTADGVGDIWIDTDDGNKPYRWSGSAWVAINRGTIEAGSFTASNPTFDGVVLIKGSTGNVVVRIQSSSGGSFVLNNTSGAQKAVFGYDGVGNQVLLDSTPDIELRTGGDLILNPTGGGGVKVGSGGTAVKAVLSNTITWNPPSIASGTAATTTVTVTGAAVGDAVFVTNEFAQDDTNLVLHARVSAANTVTLYLHNTITAGGSIDPSSRTLRVVVMKF